jgi:hypothetical protein
MRDLVLLAGIALALGGLALGGYAINQIKLTKPMRNKRR